jgi:hypothetical protein
MSDFRTRRRLSHQHRIAVVFTAALVGLGVVFTGIGNADEADADRDGGLGSVSGAVRHKAGRRSRAAA